MFSLLFNELRLIVQGITMKICRISYENAWRTGPRILSILSVSLFVFISHIFLDNLHQTFISLILYYVFDFDFSSCDTVSDFVTLCDIFSFHYVLWVFCICSRLLFFCLIFFCSIFRKCMLLWVHTGWNFSVSKV